MNARLAMYLEALRRALGSHPSADRIVAEAEDHLLESMRQLHQAGHDDDGAVTEAVARWGAPEVVANRFAAVSLPPALWLRGTRLLLLLFAGVNSALASFAALFQVFRLGQGEEAWPWVLSQMGFSGVIVAIAAVTLVAARRSRPRLTAWLLLGGITLVALGSMAGVRAYHVGETSGDFEYYLFLVTASQVAQGGLAILWVWGSSRTPRLPLGHPIDL
jgi:hypothetical protein